LREPPSEATAAYSPSCSTRISAFLRSLPDLAPTVVSTITGMPRSVVPSVPLDFSKSSTCRRVRSDVLGSYSPVNGTDRLLAVVDLSRPR
jgi:hypothetical protein